MGLVILGIDPGTVTTGYGVIVLQGSQVKCLDYGSISAPKNLKLPKRLRYIHAEIRKLYEKYKPDHTAIEKVFFGKNPDTAFKLGHIFAVCLLESETQKSEFFEYASRFVKKNVTFSGKASKELVQHFVTNFFSLKKNKKLDATDALAVALCHSRCYQGLKIQQQLKEMVL
ncbi:MAG: crossover junction endodeoxyribonuclease RuvC [Bdellovibrionales bacterium]